MPLISVLMGTRPEAIKLAPLINLLLQHPRLQVNVCSTGQHREMLDQVLALFDIIPHTDLKLMTQGQTLAQFTARALEKIDAYLEATKPDLVLLQGDTSTVFTSSLACFYRSIPVGHVEAGLRSFDLQHPFPEEYNRLAASRVSTLHFAPTETAKQNLLAERTPPQNVFVTGNTVIDALLQIQARNQAQQPTIQGFAAGLPKPYILVTGHRRENFGQGMIDLCTALNQIVEKYPQLSLVFPVHLNPNVKKPVLEQLSANPQIHLLEPVDYTQLAWLMENALFVLTDSGGIQEEAPAFGKPVLVMREKTERPEGVEAGTARLVGTNPERILHEVSLLMDNPAHFNSMATAHNPFGDGTASQQIVRILEDRLLG
ncbi:MAG: non-hydrolyzing UDP-N-acetylglucosamine 2-epimerase [Sumerlaeia bacterium]